MTALSTEWQRKWLRLDAVSSDVQKMANEVQAYTKRFSNRGTNRLLVVSGNTGGGKTHVARCIEDWASAVAITLWTTGKWNKPPVVDFVNWSSVVELEQREWTGFISDCERTDLLILDDVGSETDPFKSGKPIERLRYVLSRREMRWTVITTNVGPADWTARWDARVTDRLMRDSQVIIAPSQSYAIARRRAA